MEALGCVGMCGGYVGSQSLQYGAKTLFRHSPERHNFCRLTILRHSNIKMVAYKLSKNGWVMPFFVIFRLVREKLLVTVALDHPVGASNLDCSLPNESQDWQNYSLVEQKGIVFDILINFWCKYNVYKYINLIKKSKICEWRCQSWGKCQNWR